MRNYRRIISSARERNLWYASRNSVRKLAQVQLFPKFGDKTGKIESGVAATAASDEANGNDDDVDVVNGGDEDEDWEHDTWDNEDTSHEHLGGGHHRSFESYGWTLKKIFC